MEAPGRDVLERRVRELERELAEVRRRAEDADRERNRLALFLEQLPQPIFEMDLQGNLTYSNEAAFRLFGYTREEFSRGVNVIQTITPEYREYAREGIRRSLEGNGGEGHEYIAMRRDGSAFPVIIHSVAFQDDAGALGGLRGLIVDITRRKEMEEALRESESRYRQLVELSPDIVYKVRLFREDVRDEERQHIMAAVERLRCAFPGSLEAAVDREEGLLGPYLEMRIVFANETGLEIAGYRPEEVGTLGLGDMIAPEETGAAVRNTLLILTERRHRNMEYELLSANGDRIPVSINANLVSDEYPFIVEGVARDMRHQRRAEAALRESERRYREIFDAVPVSIWEYDFRDVVSTLREIRERKEPDYRDYLSRHADLLLDIVSRTRLADVNNETLRLYGAATKAEVLGKPYRSSHIPEALETFRDALAVYLAGGREFACESVNVTVDGRRIDVLIRMSFTAELEVSCRALVTVLDITDRKRMEQALRESEERYRTIFNTVPVSIREYDFTEAFPLVEQLREQIAAGAEDYFPEHRERLNEIIDAIRLVDFNAETVRMYGGTSREAIFRAFGHHRIREVLETYRCLVAAWLRNEREFTAETVNETLDGRRINIIMHLALPRSGGTGRALVTATDITERKRAERALRENELKFRSIVEHSPDGIAVANEEGVVTEWNRGAEVILGLPRENAMGRFIWEIIWECGGYSGPDDRDRIRDMIRRTLREGQGPWLGRPSEVLVHRPEGEPRFLQHTAYAVGSERGYMLIGTVHDITERKRVEEERIRADKLESIGILAGGIAHDFNNILVAVLGNITLAKALLKDNGEVRDILAGAEKAGFRARDLTRQLLTFSRGGAPVRESASLTEIIRESAVFSLRGSNVRCECSLPEELWPVHADRGQMSQVVGNLILNAAQAMPRGGIITVTAENVSVPPGEDLPLAPGRYVRFSIRDRGVGIPREHLARIFDPYFTTKETGSGLGLTTTYSIVRNHGGHITVESEPGAGTVFHVHLPASLDHEPSEMQPERRTIASPARILVMDDEPTICLVIRRMLEHMGHEAVTAGDGARAVELYRAAMSEGRSFDAVIMDLTVPGGMGGLEAVSRILELDPDCRAIVSSGYSEQRIASNYRDYGFRAVLNKPYRMDELADTLAGVLGGGQD